MGKRKTALAAGAAFLLLIGGVGFGTARALTQVAAAPPTTTCTTTSKTVTIPGGASKTQTYPDGLAVTVPSQPQRTVPVPYKNCTTTITQPGSTTTVTQPGQTVTVTQTVTDTTTTTTPPLPQCSDGIDNADPEDTLVDLADPGCANAQDNDETNAPPPPGEPTPIAGQGYHQAFGDEFDTFNANIWTNHAFYEDPVTGSVYVQNGVLNIDNTRAGGYSSDISVQSGPPYGGQPSRYDFTFGYAEARMRFTGGKGSWPAFWLQSLGQALWDNYPNCPKRGPAGELLSQANYELDIMEFQGWDTQTRYASQHQNTGNTCGAPNGTRGADANVGFPLANSWRTFSVLWTSSETRFYVDGVQYGATAQTYPEANQRMFIALTMQACGWDSSNSCDSSTADVLKTEVDWVHVWQK